MAAELLVKEGTPSTICFCISGSLSPASAKTDMRGDYTIDSNVTMTNVGLTNGQGRQSDKADLGATRATSYSVYAAIEGATAPTIGLTYDFIWLPSTSATTAKGNIGGNSGADADAPGTPIPSGLTVEEMALLGQRIGSLICTDDANSVLSGFVGIFSPASQWGQMLMINNSGQTLAAVDDAENHIVMVPNTIESQ